MKRFVDVGTQLWTDDEGLPNQFAWYDTVTGLFEIHSGFSVWDSWEDFERDYEGDQIERYKRLFPDFKNMKNDKENSK